MVTPRKENPQPGGRPRTDAAKLDAALTALASGTEMEEVVRRHGVSSATIYREQERRRKAAPVARPTHRGTDPPEVPPERVMAERPPPELTGNPLRIWYTKRRIEAVSQALADAEASSNLARIAPLNEQLRKWLNDLAEFSPPPPPSEDEEEARWKAAAESVIAKIEAGCRSG